MQTLQAADLLQLKVFRFIGEVEASERRLLQDNISTT